MAEAVLVWSSGGGPTVVPLDAPGEVLIGRLEDAGVRVEDQTVSRRQALLRLGGGRFLIQNLSETNPTKLRGAVPMEPVPLMDGDEIEIGVLRLRFHHLAASDRISGPICSHCGRENNSAERDCWFCGTSLVNASSQLRQRRTLVGRVVAEGGEIHDLYAGQSATVGGDGAVDVRDGTASPAPGGIVLEALDAGLSLRAGGESEITVNGERAREGGAIGTGDVLAAGGTRLVVLAR